MPTMIPHNNSAKYWRNLTLCLIAFAFTSSVAFVHLLPQHDVSCAFTLVSDSNALFAVAIAISSFMWFKNIQIKHCRFINTIAASCFGVLCIHANNDTMRQWLWSDTIDVRWLFGTCNFVWKIILAVLAIYVVCTIVDYLRIRYVEKPIFRILDNNFAQCKWW